MTPTAAEKRQEGQDNEQAEPQEQALTLLQVASPPSLPLLPKRAHPPPTLLNLPFDLHHLLITAYLPQSYTSLLALRSTCTYFAYYIPAHYLRRVRRRTARHLTRLESQDWLVWYGARGPGSAPSGSIGVVVHGGAGETTLVTGFPYFPLYLACYVCLERLPRWRFVDVMTRSHHAPTRTLSHTRWCKPCGLRNHHRHPNPDPPRAAQPGAWYREANLDERDLDRRPAERTTLHLRGPMSCIRCSKRDRPWELLWGCGDCFRKEKTRRRDLELLRASLGRSLPAVMVERLEGRLSGMGDGDDESGGCGSPGGGGSVKRRRKGGKRGKGKGKGKGNVRDGNAVVIVEPQLGEEMGRPHELIPKRETRCEDCWRFPVRRKGDESDAVYEGLEARFWCHVCQAMLRRAVDASDDKVNTRTSVQ